MKKIILIFTLVMSLAGITNSFAQDKKQKSPDEMAQNRSAMWKKELALTDDQTAQLKTALSDRITKVGQAKGLTDKGAKKTAVTAAKTEFDTKAKSIFTPEQYAKFTAKKEELKKKNQAKKGADKVVEEDLD